MKLALGFFCAMGLAGSLGGAAPTPSIKSEDLLVKNWVSVSQVTAALEMDPMYGVADTMIKISASVVGACSKTFMVDRDVFNPASSILKFAALKTNRAHIQPACENHLEYNWSPIYRSRLVEGAVHGISLVVDSGQGPGWDSNGQVILARDFLVSGELTTNTVRLPTMRGWLTTYRNVQVTRVDRPLSPKDHGQLFADWIQRSLSDLRFQSGTASLFINVAYYESDPHQIVFVIAVDGKKTGSTTEKDLRQDLVSLISPKIAAQKFPFPLPKKVKIFIQNIDELKALSVLK